MAASPPLVSDTWTLGFSLELQIRGLDRPYRQPHLPEHSALCASVHKNIHCTVFEGFSLPLNEPLE